MSDSRLKIIAVPGSPYSRKLLALLRYRRIPYEVTWRGPEGTPADLPKPKVDLLPTVYRQDPDGSLSPSIDTTPIIRDLEFERSGRAATPEDPALRFLDGLVEDFADEWLTKAMFHYRWAYEADIKNAARMLTYWADPSMPSAQARQWGEAFAQRQISRLYVVGSNAVTGPTIEASYERILTALEQIVSTRPFLLGARPSFADFATYGQLTQLLAVDPTPAALGDRIAPRLKPWIERVEDLSGLEPQPEDWIRRDEAGAALKPILDEIGRVYAPFLLANAAAVERGEPSFETEIDGRAWSQPVFPYQAKCLMALRDDFAALSDADKTVVAEVIAGSGVESVLS